MTPSTQQAEILIAILSKNKQKAFLSLVLSSLATDFSVEGRGKCLCVMLLTKAMSLTHCTANHINHMNHSLCRSFLGTDFHTMKCHADHLLSHFSEQPPAIVSHPS